MQEEITRRVLDAIADATVSVAVDGNRAMIDVVSPVFSDLSRVKKQQLVYACIEDLIASGDLHAVTIKADIPAGV
ncbi:MAG TPA: cell division protein BolA [Gammaproteobacteria bacterium]|nr:cell division protein BolA [Gammaproteobacteria bacterium]HBF63228.1 cell division protein BolA [Gammaproteobacteria bacterium]HBK11557.1 cell division protein BolA [Gammaproteobacteria bacterium]|tara:strand:+ start:489 stop:713 length:225 start_codon:yes stop_codon:yes gene_type:complete